MKPLRVLIVEDSISFQKLLTYIFDSCDDIEVVGTALDPFEARDKIKFLNPDVITLDINMPRMDGATFLENLMRLRPMPVVMISSLTERNAAMALRVLDLGAVDYVGKPKTTSPAEMAAYAEEVISKVKAAGRVNVKAFTQRNAATNAKASPVRSSSETKVTSTVALQPKPESAPKSCYDNARRIIAIGSSTGGTVAVGKILESLPVSTVGIVIAQHIPEAFSASFAERLDKTCPVTVVEATDGALIRNGHVYIAPGYCHLSVKKDGLYYVCRLEDTPPVNKHRPSVDVLFESVASNVGRNALGIILTGMGRDGADGLQSMKNAGSPTIAQDEKSSVVWGMPGEAVKLGCVDEIISLPDIAAKIIDYTDQHKR
ncbi:MAG: chemotaxis response regulator protein-glutamate methylesterase [Pseudomonadales bacterium]